MRMGVESVDAVLHAEQSRHRKPPAPWASTKYVLDEQGLSTVPRARDRGL